MALTVSDGEPWRLKRDGAADGNIDAADLRLNR